MYVGILKSVTCLKNYEHDKETDTAQEMMKDKV